jgi:hypothetical protein
MTYGHAERNLAFIRQLEAETQQLRVRSAVGRVLPFDTQPQGDDEAAAVAAFNQAATGLDRDGRHDGHDELPRGLVPAQVRRADGRRSDQVPPINDRASAGPTTRS